MVPSMPTPLVVIAAVSLALGGVCAIVIAVDLFRHPQKMTIMDAVWPLTALWSGPIGLWGYFRYGRAGSRDAAEAAKEHGEEPPNMRQPFRIKVGKAATHCGSGCTLGDIVAELAAAVVPLSIFGHHIFGSWIYDYVLALAFGILFQYLTIKPMKELSRKAGLKAAFKADVLSLTAWQVGMYGWMAIATFAIFHGEIPKSSPVFWFMMQIGMVLGFLTSYPVNWFLLRRGVKEEM
jgi:hypothetical protein